MSFSTVVVDDKEDAISKLQLVCACFRDPADPKTREPSVPVSTSTGPDPDRPSAPSETALVPLARAEDDEMMEDVAEMAGGGQVSGQDALANLETTLRPVEKYAVRFLEEVSIARIILQMCSPGPFSVWLPCVVQCLNQQQQVSLHCYHLVT